jgi:hypothetical protein
MRNAVSFLCNRSLPHNDANAGEDGQLALEATGDLWQQVCLRRMHAHNLSMQQSSQDHWEDWTTKGGRVAATMDTGTELNERAHAPRKWKEDDEPKKEQKEEEEDRKMTKEELEELEIIETGLLDSDDDDEVKNDGNVYYPNDGSCPFIVQTVSLFGSPIKSNKKARRAARAAALHKRVKKLQAERQRKKLKLCTPSDNEEEGTPLGSIFTPRRCEYCEWSPCFMDTNYDTLWWLSVPN